MCMPPVVKDNDNDLEAGNNLPNNNSAHPFNPSMANELFETYGEDPVFLEYLANEQGLVKVCVLILYMFLTILSPLACSNLSHLSYISYTPDRLLLPLLLPLLELRRLLLLVPCLNKPVPLRLKKTLTAATQHLRIAPPKSFHLC